MATLLALTLALLPVACSESGSGSGASASPADEAPRRNPALPRFSGPALDGGQVGTELFRKKRGVIFLFAEEDRGADPLARLIRGLVSDAKGANVAFLGISRDDSPEKAKSFLARHGLDMPVLRDPSRRISQRLRAGGREAGVIVVDAQGDMLAGFSGIDPKLDIGIYDGALRDALRFESASDAVSVSYGVRPKAPGFEVKELAGDPLTLASLEGQVVAVVFFLHTCPHCHDALKFLDRFRAELDRDDLAIVAISVQEAATAVRRMQTSLGVNLPLYLDPGGAAQKAYGHGGGVPDIVVLDREHRVRARHSGMDARIEALLKMELRQALGVENPILLLRDAYSGEAACRICHSGQHETWSLTSHAYAFDTLVEHGENKNAECVGCHTVGWQQKGGYSLERPKPYLEGVGCESCHGRGGPHQSPEFVAQGYQATCEGCHTPEHSLRFNFAESLPLVSHAANQRFANLSVEERKALLERRDKRERQLFDHAEFVGSESCQGCHASEYEIWSKGPHAKAFATLEAHGKADSADCQRCHTTGFEAEGGFPDGGHAFSHVGCESCHGPGGNHVAENARKDGTILALTDKCDSCVILQICGSCHDDANDPDFEFEVVEKIDKIRHGFRDRPGGAAE